MDWHNLQRGQTFRYFNNKYHVVQYFDDDGRKLLTWRWNKYSRCRVYQVFDEFELTKILPRHAK